MAIYTIRNLTKGTVIVPAPVNRSLAANATMTVKIPVSLMECWDKQVRRNSIQDAINAGIISVISAADPSTQDEIETPTNSSVPVPEYRTVVDAAARDALPTAHRTEGMLVHTNDTGEFWVLGSDLITWTSLITEGSTPIGPVPLGGDLAGSYPSPTVPGLANKVNTTDPRLTNAREPTAHETSHLPIGTDPLPVASDVQVGLLSAVDHQLLPTSDQKAALAGTGTPNISNPYVNSDDSRLPTSAQVTYIPASGEKSALSGTYGTPGAANRYVTETDPTFLIHRDRVRDVGKSIESYHTIESALASIPVSPDPDAPTATNPWLIRIFPGIYQENPLTMIPFVHVQGQGSWYDVIIQAESDTNHLFDMVCGSTLSCVSIIGPIGTGWAAINFEDSGMQPAFVDNVVIQVGYYGVYAHPTSDEGVIHCHQVVNAYAGSVIQRLFYATDKANIALQGCSCMSDVAGAVIQGAVFDGSDVQGSLDQYTFRVGGSTDALYVNGGAHVRLTASSFREGTNATHVGPTGASYVDIQALAISSEFTRDLYVESGSATVTGIGTGNQAKFVIASGATVIGLLIDTTGNNSVLFGDLEIGPAHTPLNDYLQAGQLTGIWTGGGIERVSGLRVKVLAGVGFCPNIGGYPVEVSWFDTNVDVPANSSPAYIIVDSASNVSSTPIPPDRATTIEIGVVQTSATEVQFCSRTIVYTPHPQSRNFDYVTNVIGPVFVDGGIVSKHAPTSLSFDIVGGDFYVHNLPRTFLDATPVTFTYWYKSSVAGRWKTVPGCTNLDTENYDDASGILAAVTPGLTTRQLLFITYNNSGVEYHVVYGQEIFLNPGTATTNPTPPTIFSTEACRVAAFKLVQGVSDINTVVDQRPFLGQLVPASSAVVRHNDLSGRDFADCHSQYQLAAEKGAASGYCGLNGSGKVAATNIDTATSSPGIISVGASSVGSGPKLAFEDHNHSIDVAGTPVSVGTSNNSGIATTLARTDHVHQIDDAFITAAKLAGGIDIGTQTTGTLAGTRQTYGTGANTSCQGNDSRLTDDRTASGIRTTTTIVSLSGAPAPSIGQSPVATSGSAATWQSVELSVNKNSLSGYAGLDPSGKLLGTQIPYGSSLNTVCEGNDSRLGDDRIAADLRSATTIISVSGATAPSTGQALVALNSTSASWQGVEQPVNKNSPNGYAGLDGSTKLSGTQQTYGIVANTACQGNDSRLNDDRTANGLRTATTTVAISAATAPSAGQAPVATSSTAATWQSIELTANKGAVSGYCGLDGSAKVAVSNINTATTTPGTISVGAAAVGSGPKLAFEDHNHSIDITGTPVSIGATNNAGTATSLARRDHIHQIDDSSIVAGKLAGDININLQTTGTLAGTRQTYGSASNTACEGNDTRLSNDRTASGIRTATTIVSVSGDTAPSVNQALVATSGAAATWQSVELTTNKGSASGYAPLDSSSKVPVANINIATVAPGVIAVGTGTTGSGPKIALEDHNHSASTGTPVGIGLANATGSASSLARSDHIHAPQTVTTAEVDAASPTTTTSATNGIMNGMTITPPAGTYLVHFSGDIKHSASPRTITTSIYEGVTQHLSSVRTWANNNANERNSFHCMAKVTVNGAQAITGQWATSAATATCYARQLYIIPVA